LDSFFPVKLDVFFAPNLHFISVSEDIKFVLTVHDLSFEFYKNCYSLKRRLWHRFLNSRLQCKQADIILTPSDNTKSDLKRFYGVDENKIFTVYPGVGLNSREVESNFGSSKFNLPDKYILFLGAIEPRKNILSLVSAYEHGRFFDKGIYLVIAGAAGWKNKNVLHKIKKTQGVLYVGYVSEAEKINIYSKALLFVYPSFYEGFGFPVLEAMSAGVPVITSNRSSLPEITEGAAYLANPFNVADIERGMKKILEDFKLRSLLVEKGKEQCKKFKWNKTAEQFLSVINKYENRN
jgi:glycosyltransferase involved in cell wall biosynthesis